MLGHVQRGGTPTAFDRVLATRFGLHAVGRGACGVGEMVALRGTDIVRVPLAGPPASSSGLPELYAEAESFSANL